MFTYIIGLQLSPENAAAENAELIFDILLQFLGQEHIDYAIELGMYSKWIGKKKFVRFQALFFFKSYC